MPYFVEALRPGYRDPVAVGGRHDAQRRLPRGRAMPLPVEIHLPTQLAVPLRILARHLVDLVGGARLDLHAAAVPCGGVEGEDDAVALEGEGSGAAVEGEGAAAGGGEGVAEGGEDEEEEEEEEEAEEGGDDVEEGPPPLNPREGEARSSHGDGER